jgi:hypothetical protein
MIRRFEDAAHGALPRSFDTAALVAAGAIVVGMQMTGSPDGTAVDVAVIPGLIATFAIAARVGREASNRRRGERSFELRLFSFCRALYLVCTLLSIVAALVTIVGCLFST